jgi:hypothetical protein
VKWSLVAVSVVLVALAALVVAVETVNVLPRRLAAYIEQRASGHRPAIERAGQLAARALRAVDRGRREIPYLLPVPRARTPATVEHASAPRARIVLVATAADAREAIATAEPGDAITFLPGTYRFDGSYIAAQRPGAPLAPIVVRAAVRGSVRLEFDLVEGFLVSAPYWSFENFEIHGVCRAHADCEHAFHVAGAGEHFTARHNTIVDFNAHFKINGDGEAYPDWGVIEDNVLTNTAVRDTDNPVTPIDLVAASHWRIRGNRISDFAKAQSDRVSYGAFAKGGGSDNRFERNVVVCEERLRDAPGQRVGLSLGGGGSGDAACRGGHCIVEQEHGVIASNLIAACSDDGIYLNRAAMSAVTHNTLVDTGGITGRFGETSADVEGNLVDGPIRGFAGAALHARDNFATRVIELYVGSHPVRDLFVDAAALDLRWREEPPRRAAGTPAPMGLCGKARSRQPAYGAFDDISRCALGAG